MIGRAMRSLFLGLLLVTGLATHCALAGSLLHRGNGAEPDTLDVHKSQGVPEANIHRDLFEGLVSEAADGSLQPGAAERWQMSPDGRGYIFYLRRDGHWSNGEPVTAQDFVYAYRRALSPNTASKYAFILWPIENAEDVSKGNIKDLDKIAVEAIDDYTLSVKLKAPTPYFLSMLTHHMAYPVYRKALESHGRRWTRPGNLVSNGPYKLVEWVPQSHVKLAKNEHYRDQGEIAIENVIFYPTEDKASELKRFRAGELDVTYDVPSDQVPWIEANLGEVFRNSPYLGVYYYALNTQVAPFKDKVELRQALAFAIDREILTEKVAKAGELPAYSWVPPGVHQYVQQPIPQKQMTQAEREALAQALYAQSGHSQDKPAEIEILYNTSDNHKKLAIAIAAMWKKVLGVRTRLRNEEWKVYVDSRSQMKFQVARAGWIGDYNDANTFLELFKSDVGGMNPSAYANKEYDALMRQAALRVETKARAELMQRAEQVMLADMPVIPIYFYTTQHLVSHRVSGWIDNVKDVHPTRYLKLEN
jgi:oligopeptide transport system substrate-binding protein